MAQTILIVEDEILVGMMLKKTIEHQGYRVIDIVTTGEAAIAKVAEQVPDLLFMDVTLSGEIDGITTAEKIKAIKDIPVIFFTGNHLEGDMLRRLKSVCPVAILDKMGSMQVVIETVKRTLSV